MAEYNVGDNVILKDDGQEYKVVGVRTEDCVVLFDLEKGDERAFVRFTVLRSQLQVQKAYTPKTPQFLIYKANVATMPTDGVYNATKAAAETMGRVLAVDTSPKQFSGS